MEESTIKLLNELTNKSINRMNEFVQAYNGNTIEARVSYLIHEIEYLKLSLIKKNNPIKEIKRAGRPAPIVYLFDINGELIESGTIKYLSDKYKTHYTAMQAALKRGSMLYRKYFVSKKDTISIESKPIKLNQYCN